MSKDFPESIQEALPSAKRVADMRNKFEKAGVKYVLCCWIDMLGIPKTKPVPMVEWEGLCAGKGPQFAVHSVSMVPDAGPADPDQIMVPDLDSAAVCPWDNRYGWVIADLYHGDTKPYRLCPRTVLRRQIKAAKDVGYKFFTGFEPEFIIMRPLENGELWKAFDDDPLPGEGFRPKRQPYGYDVEFSLDQMPYVSEVIDILNSLEWGVKDVVAEGAYSQIELDFGFSDMLTTADRFIFLRILLKELAKEHGLIATFMPKPTTGDWRSGSHINTSVQSTKGTGKNLLEAKGGGWSDLTFNMLGGLIKHGKAICGVSCPTVNSYKGLVDFVPGFEGGTVTWAPTHITYGINNRSAMYRLPQTRYAIENRAADLTMNVYMAFAMHIAASLEGITRKMKAPKPTNVSLYEADKEKLKKAGVERTPKTLQEAIDAIKADPLSKRVMGETLLSCWLTYKQDEWDRYYTTVSEWEREEYMRFF